MIFLFFFLQYYKLMQIEINNKIIVAILSIVMLYLIYHFTTTYTIVKINKHIEPFVNVKELNDNTIITDISIQQKAHDELNYNDRADVVISEADLNLVMNNLLQTDSNLEQDNKQFELITRTDQDKMFDDLEKKLIDQYDQTTVKDGFYKSIERPLQGSSLPSSRDVKNSSLNPVMNPNMFNDNNLQNNETLWQAYDKLTSNGHVNNYEELEPNDISTQYMLGNNMQYGSTFDNYSK